MNWATGVSLIVPLEVRNESGAYSEKDLEMAILREMESFLLEMGNGFCFVERQKRMSVGKDDFFTSPFCSITGICAAW